MYQLYTNGTKWAVSTARDGHSCTKNDFFEEVVAPKLSDWQHLSIYPIKVELVKKLRPS